MEDYTYPLTVHSNVYTTTKNIAYIYPEDIAWFRENGAKLSGETLMDGTYVFYADVGVFEEDDETPREAIVSATHGVDDPYETFALLRKRAEKLLNER